MPVRCVVIAVGGGVVYAVAGWSVRACRTRRTRVFLKGNDPLL